MAFIGLGLIGNNLIPILIGCIICFLSRILILYEKTELFEHAVLPNFIVDFSLLFTIIPHIIIKKQIISGYNDDKLNQEDNKKELIYNEKTDVIILMEGKYPYILLSSVLCFVQSVILMFTIKIKSNTWILDILFTLIFYYLSFKIKLYKHHYLSIILIILLGIILDLVLKNLQSDINYNVLLLLLSLSREIIYSLYVVTNKYLFEKKFCSVYEIIFFNGLIELILFSIFSIFDYYFFKFDNYDYFTDFNYIKLLVIIGTVITQFGLFICIFYTNKKNTPCHIFIIYVFGKLAYHLDFSRNSIMIIIVQLFILILLLIFNEIIEINCFGLSKYTKKNIINRAEKEEKEIESQTYDDSDSINTQIQLINDDNILGYEEN